LTSMMFSRGKETVDPEPLDALACYDEVLRLGDGELRLRCADGRVMPLDVSRWHAPPDPADDSLLDRCQGPTLDVGCGPGRLTVALTRRGLPALGLDIAPTAIALTRARGGLALRRSIFDRVPGERRWSTVLLVDGNVGIGGDPAALFGRVAELLSTDGRLLAEVEPEDVCERMAVRIENSANRHSRPFRWARIGAPAAIQLAKELGYELVEQWEHNNRCFLSLLRDCPDDDH